MRMTIEFARRSGELPCHGGLACHCAGTDASVAEHKSPDLDVNGGDLATAHGDGILTYSCFESAFVCTEARNVVKLYPVSCS